MRFTHLLAAVPAAAITTLALGAVTAGAAPPPLPTVPPTLPKKCAKDGVCFVKTFKGATITLHVTGTSGNDKIVITNVQAFGNNSLPSIAVNGVKTGRQLDQQRPVRDPRARRQRRDQHADDERHQHEPVRHGHGRRR